MFWLYEEEILGFLVRYELLVLIYVSDQRQCWNELTTFYVSIFALKQQS